MTMYYNFAWNADGGGARIPADSAAQRQGMEDTQLLQAGGEAEDEPPDPSNVSAFCNTRVVIT